MAIRIINYDAFTDTGSVAIGVSIPFNNYQGVFSQTYTTEQQIKSNIINFVLTERGERPLNFDFGFSLSSYLFNKQITSSTLSDLEINLLNALKTQFNNIPNLKFSLVTASPNYDDNSINVIINYNFAGNPQEINITT